MWLSSGWTQWKHSCWYHRGHGHHASLRVWLLPLQSRWNTGQAAHTHWNLNVQALFQIDSKGDLSSRWMAEPMDGQELCKCIQNDMPGGAVSSIIRLLRQGWKDSYKIPIIQLIISFTSLPPSKWLSTVRRGSATALITVTHCTAAILVHKTLGWYVNTDTLQHRRLVVFTHQH